MDSSKNTRTKLTSTQKALAFIMFTPVILFGLLSLNVLFQYAIVTIFPDSKLATNVKKTISREKTPEYQSAKNKIKEPENLTFLSASKTGYTIWIDDRDCIIVKDLTEGDLIRLNSTLSEFKKAIKIEIGAKCVLFY